MLLNWIKGTFFTQFGMDVFSMERSRLQATLSDFGKLSTAVVTHLPHIQFKKSYATQTGDDDKWWGK